MTDKKLGGKRPGSGRKPDPNKLVNIQSKVPPELRDLLIENAAKQGISVSKLICVILKSYSVHGAKL